MLSASVFESFAAAGFVVTPPVFAESELAGVRAECQRTRSKKGGWSVLGAARDSKVLMAFVKDDRFRRICAETLGSNIDLFFDGILYKPPRGGKELRWHQDSGFGRTDPSFISCWVPLSAGSAASGGLWVAPGSHLAGPVDHTRGASTAKEYAGAVSCTTPAASHPLDPESGQVVVLHSELLHRTGPNETDTPRLSFQCGFASSETRYLDAGLPLDHKLPIFRSDG